MAGQPWTGGALMPRETLIQLRRGIEADLPPLEDGEPGWCLDTFELYIGAGGVNKLVGGGGIVTSPLTTKGDLWGFSATNVRVPVGTDGTFLTANSANPAGLAWTTITIPPWAVTQICPVHDADGLTAVVGGTGAGEHFDGWGSGGVVMTGVYVERKIAAGGSVVCELNPITCCDGVPAPPRCCDSPSAGVYGAASLTIPCCGALMHLRFHLVAVSPPPAGYSQYYQLSGGGMCDYWGRLASGGGGGGGGGSGSGSGSGSGGGSGGGTDGDGGNWWISLTEPNTGCIVTAMSVGCLDGYDDYLFIATFQSLDGTAIATFRTAANVSLACGDGASFRLRLAAGIGADTPPIPWAIAGSFNVDLASSDFPRYCPLSSVETEGSA